MIHRAAEYLKETFEVTPLRSVKEVVQKHPKKIIAALGVVLGVVLARRFHHNFVTYPDIGGRHNSANIPPLRHPNNRGLTA